MRSRIILAGIALACCAATGVVAQTPTPPLVDADIGIGIYPPTAAADSAAVGIFTNKVWNVGKPNSAIVRAENHGDASGSVTITLQAQAKDGSTVSVTPASYTVTISPGQSTAVEFTATPPTKTKVTLTACATTPDPLLTPGHPEDDCITGKSVQVK